MQQEARTPYEVFCPSCKVTFAVGTKRCVHCGARLTGRSGARGFARSHPSEALEPGFEPETVIVEEQTSGRSRLPISPVTLLWIVLIAGSVAQRACQGD